MKKYNRFFAFGCSYTDYYWPTWANIIARDTGLPSQNWGYSGVGNIYIHHKMVEAKIKQSINDDDLVIVNWSSWHREDRVDQQGYWTSGGNIFNNNPYYDKRFLKKYYSPYNDIVKNATAIISGNNTIKIAYQSHMIDYENFVEYAGINQLHTDKLIKNYSWLRNALPEKKLFDNSGNTSFDGRTSGIDFHPDVLGHLSHASKVCANLFGRELKQETVDYYNIMQERIGECIQHMPRKNYWQEIGGRIAKIYSLEDY
jgi:hypothetical protein|tara:strand:- start:35244 stop:36014 length:771 start_codon:yes stop_codon:yes gene_type:complete